MNILFVIDSLGSGGAEITTLELAAKMFNEGNTVTIISVRDEMMQNINTGAKIITLNFKKSRFKPYVFLAKWRLKKYIAELEKETGKFDLIFSILVLSNKLVSSINKNNIFYCIHSALSPSYIKNRKGLRRLVRLIKLRNLYNNKRIITVCNDMALDLKLLGIKPKSLTTIYNPVNFDKIQTLSSQPCQTFLPQEYIVHVGRFDIMKRHDLLIEAYRKTGIKVPLVFVGDGPTRKKIEQLVDEENLTDRIIFAGHQPNPYPYIKNAKLLVVSSDYEGLSMVLIEALFLDTAVVSTNCPTGPGEILHKKLSKYLAQPSDPVSLAKTMLAAISDVESNTYPFEDADLARFHINTISKQYLGLQQLINE